MQCQHLPVTYTLHGCYCLQRQFLQQFIDNRPVSLLSGVISLYKVDVQMRMRQGQSALLPAL